MKIRKCQINEKTFKLFFQFNRGDYPLLFNSIISIFFFVFLFFFLAFQIIFKILLFFHFGSVLFCFVLFFKYFLVSVFVVVVVVF